jgi:hypothetical protein
MKKSDQHSWNDFRSADIPLSLFPILLNLFLLKLILQDIHTQQSLITL